MSALILSALKTQLPMLVEKFQPQLESGLRSSLKTMKTQHPEHSALFLTNWNKLDAAVKSELGSAPPVGAPPVGARRRVKRTRRNKRSSK